MKGIKAGMLGCRREVVPGSKVVALRLSKTEESRLPWFAERSPESVSHD